MPDVIITPPGSASPHVRPNTNSFINHRIVRGDDLEVLRAGLRHRAQEVAEWFLGPPNKELSTPNEMRFGSRGSLAVALRGEKRGLWFDFGDHEGKDLFALIMRERGGSFSDAVK